MDVSDSRSTISGSFSPSPCSNVRAFMFMCHTLRFSGMPSIISYSFMSSQMLSSHLLSGLPLLIFHCACMVPGHILHLPSFLNTWPYHLSRLFLRKVVIGSMLASLQMSSFLMWSFLVLPLAHLSIFCVLFFFTAQRFVVNAALRFTDVAESEDGRMGACIL